MHHIITDEEVMKKSKHVLKVLAKTLGRSEAAQGIDGFCAFIEDAAALLDQKPDGARWLVKEYEFYTRKDIQEELQQIKLAAQRFASILERRADLILFNKIEELQNLLNKFLASPQMLAPFDDTLPNPGGMAAQHNWRNFIYRRLCTMSEVRLGGRFQAFVREVHRVLLNLEIPLDANTAHHIAGAETTLIER